MIIRLKRRIIWDCCTDLLNPPLAPSSILIIPKHLSEQEKERLRNEHKAQEAEREREKRLREPELLNILEGCIKRIKDTRPNYKQRDILYSRINGTSKLTGAPFVCNKCGNKDNKQLILDEKTGDTICNGSDGIGCGNIINDHEVDHGANKRHFADDTEDNRYFGSKPDLLMPDAYNMRTSISTHSNSGGGHDSNFKKLAYTLEKVEKNLSNINTDDRRTREGYKTENKIQAWSIMQNLTDVLSLHQQVFQKAKEEFAYYRDCKEQINQLNGIVAACIVLAYEELSEKFDLEKEKKSYKYSIPTISTIIEPNDHSIMINHLKPMDSWDFEEIKSWIENVMKQNEILDKEFQEIDPTNYSNGDKGIVISNLLDYIKLTYDNQIKAQNEQKIKTNSSSNGSNQRPEKIIGRGLSKNNLLNKTDIIVPGFGSTTVKGRERIMGVVKPKPTNIDNSTIIEKKTLLTPGQIFTSMQYKKVLTDSIHNLSTSIENISKICSGLHSQRVRRLQYDNMIKDQLQRKKNVETGKLKKITTNSNHSLDLEAPTINDTADKLEDTSFELDSLISSNTAISDSTTEKLLGKRKDIKPQPIKEEIIIKTEDQNLNIGIKIKKPKIVID